MLVIFDFDGVLVDSHGIVNKLFSRIAKEHGLNIEPTEFEFSSGTRFELRLWMLAKMKNIDLTQEVIDKIIEKGRREYLTNYYNHVELFPGAKELLIELKKKKVKTAIASNGSRIGVNQLVEKFKIRDYFDVILTFDDVKNGKPDPEMFLKAADYLNESTNDSIVIEDSAEGIKAAKRANMKVVGVATTLEKPLLREADIIVDSIEFVSYELLEDLLKK